MDYQNAVKEACLDERKTKDKIEPQVQLRTINSDSPDNSPTRRKNRRPESQRDLGAMPISSEHAYRQGESQNEGAKDPLLHNKVHILWKEQKRMQQRQEEVREEAAAGEQPMIPEHQCQSHYRRQNQEIETPLLHNKVQIL